MSATPHIPRATRRWLLALLTACLAAIVLLVPAAQAAAPPTLWTACDQSQPAGQRCEIPRGIAADSHTGHVFVADAGNGRLVELDAFGGFVKTWGWDVVASGPDDEPARNAVQELTVDATGGDFKLQTGYNFGPVLTPAIPFDASPGDLQVALEEDGPRSVIEPGDVSVSGPDGGPWRIEFTGSLANQDMAELRVVESTLTGGAAEAGISTIQHGARFEVCVADRGDVCKPGQRGYSANQRTLPREGAPGQFSGPVGVALDSTGDVYVADVGNHSVQKFDRQGEFVLAFGGGVDKTAVSLREEEEANAEPVTVTEAEENLCTAASGHTCGAGVEGSADGQFGDLKAGDFIEVDTKGTPSEADDVVWVGDQGRIQAFDSDGVYQNEIAVPGKTVQSLTVDRTGNLYVIYFNEPDVRKLTAAGDELSTPRFRVEDPEGVRVPSAVAVDSEGSVYAFGPTSVSGGRAFDPIFKFSPTGELREQFGKGEFVGSTGLATNLCAGNEPPGDLYVSNSVNSNFGQPFVRAYGTPPTNCGLTITGPATEVAETSATLTGSTNPNGEAIESCRFEYGTDATYGSLAPCDPGAWQSDEGEAALPVQAAVTGLAAVTTYHYRLATAGPAGPERGTDRTFKTLGPPVITDSHAVSAAYTEATIAASVNPEGLSTSCSFEYGPGTEYANSTAPVSVGEDRTGHPVSTVLAGLVPGATYHWRLRCQNTAALDEGIALGPDRTLTTFVPPVAQTSCANQAFRTAASAPLPDCRAYEMVSPVDKNGGDIVAGKSSASDAGGYVQASSDGDRIAYTAKTTFADEPAGFVYNEYVAGRAAGGWSTHGVHPPVTGTPVDSVLFGKLRDFMAFTPDLCSAWLVDYQTPTLTADAQQGYRNLYRREDCGAAAGRLEALTSAPPALPEGTAVEYVAQRSVQGISADGGHALFVAKGKLTADALEGEVAQVYDRSGGANHLVSVLPSGSAATAASALGSGWGARLDNAVAADGSRVYWTTAISNEGEGRIMQRRNPVQAEDCLDPAMACTTAVGGTALTPAFFWAASSDGAKALFSELTPSGKHALFVFEESAAKRQVAAGVEGVAGASEDLSRIYFVSMEAIGGAGENAAGEEAQASQPNLYLDDAGTLRFVTTLAGADVEPSFNAAYRLATTESYLRVSRVSPDGSRIVFESRAPLTGFDNTDAESKPAVEVFSYEAAGGELSCVSCNPSGARPETRELREPYALLKEGNATGVDAAGWIPTWQHPTHASNVLSADGRRIFFNSNDALLPRDSNSAQDVYEWEAPGAGSCHVGDADYFPGNDGCLYLISSGTSPFESQFWEASPDGEDIFFTTESSLLPQDPGLIDLYDARVGGGFAQPEVKAQCEGEACQSPPPPPEFGAPASRNHEGPGNPPALRSCAGPAHRAAKLARRARRARHVARRLGAPKARRHMRVKARHLAHRARGLSSNAKRCRRHNRRASR